MPSVRPPPARKAAVACRAGSGRNSPRSRAVTLMPGWRASISSASLPVVASNTWNCCSFSRSVSIPATRTPLTRIRS